MISLDNATHETSTRDSVGPRGAYDFGPRRWYRQSVSQTGREQKPLANLGDWAVQTGAHKTLGRSIAVALGLSQETGGLQIAFTSMSGEGHIALVCDLNGRRQIFLAHLNSMRRGVFWRTSEDGALKATAVRLEDGVHPVENSKYANDFDAEKQFFAAMLSDAAKVESHGRAPSCQAGGGEIAGTI
jgi:hypothetical protein